MWFSFALLLAAQADIQAQIDAPPLPPLPPWSTEQLDPSGLTRFNLVTRATFADGQGPFSSSSAWSTEIRAQVRARPGLVFSGALPLGITNGYESDARLVIGNLALGASFGGVVVETPELVLRVGGGLDAYLPTAPSSETTQAALLLFGAFRGYEVQLYLPQTLSFRGRLHVEASIGAVTLGGELGLVPAISLPRGDQGLVMLFGGAARAGINLGVAEPYLEFSGATALGGIGDVAPPVQMTPGLRLNLLDAFQPAIFVSFNFVAPDALLFGLDLASALRPTSKSRDRENPTSVDILDVEETERDFDF
ncbi:MAG: hypothetical protein IPG45_25935 [Deltaproteobacteria bacterium]|nr:hypothetical protein [Deltaproteobacteria bacterium]